MGTTRGATGAARIALVRLDGYPPGGEGHAVTTAPEPPLELLGAASALAADDPALRLAVFDAAATEGGNGAALGRALASRPDAVVIGPHGPSVGAPRPWGGARLEWSNGARIELVRAGLLARDGAPPDARPLRIALVEDDAELARHLLAEAAFDVVVRGEAEETLPRAIRAGLAPRAPAERWHGVRGVSWSDAGEIRHGAPARRPLSPATPAWELLDLAAYRGPRSPSRSGALDRLAHHRLAPGFIARRSAPRGVATLRSTEACADSCPTCRGSFGAPGPERPVREVLAEVRDLVTRRGVRELRIVDHAFDGKPERAAEIARGIARIRSAPAYGGLVVRFPSGFRGDGLTPELTEALVGLGLRRFDVRVDTASDRLQRLLRRNVRLGRAREGLAAVARAGGVPRLHLRLGLPTETVGEAAHTIRWAASSRALELVVQSGAGASFGPHFQREGTDEIDDFPAQRRRAIAAFLSHPRRGPARLWRAGVSRAFVR